MSAPAAITVEAGTKSAEPGITATFKTSNGRRYDQFYAASWLDMEDPVKRAARISSISASGGRTGKDRLVNWRFDA